METVYPASASALARGRRRRGGARPRPRTQPVTFAEIKEVDEEKEEEPAAAAPAATDAEGARGRRRPDVLEERLGRQWAAARRRRARSDLRERHDEPPEPRAGSEPRHPRDPDSA